MNNYAYPSYPSTSVSTLHESGAFDRISSWSPGANEASNFRVSSTYLFRDETSSAPLLGQSATASYTGSDASLAATKILTENSVSALPAPIPNLEDALREAQIAQKHEASRLRSSSVSSARGQTKRASQRVTPYPIQTGPFTTTMVHARTRPSWPANTADLPWQTHYFGSPPARDISQSELATSSIGQPDSLSSSTASSLEPLHHRSQSEGNFPAYFQQGMNGPATATRASQMSSNAWSSSKAELRRSESASSLLSHIAPAPTSVRLDPLMIGTPSTSAGSSSPSTGLSIHTPSPTALSFHSQPPSPSISIAPSPRHNLRSSVGSLLRNSRHRAASMASQLSPTKVKRGAKLSAMDRKHICEYSLAHPHASQETIGGIFMYSNVERTTISKTLKDSEKWLAINASGLSTAPYITSMAPGISSNSGPASTVNSAASSGTIRSTRAPRWPAIESAVIRWAREESKKGANLSDQRLRVAARREADALGITEERFKASDGWLSRFKSRAGIHSGRFSELSLAAMSIPEETGLYSHPSPAISCDSLLSMDQTESGQTSPQNELAGHRPWDTASISSISSQVHSDFTDTSIRERPGPISRGSSYSSQPTEPNTPSNLYFSSLSMASPSPAVFDPESARYRNASSFSGRSALTDYSSTSLEPEIHSSTDLQNCSNTPPSASAVSQYTPHSAFATALSGMYQGEKQATRQITGDHVNAALMVLRDFLDQHTSQHKEWSTHLLAQFCSSIDRALPASRSESTTPNMLDMHTSRQQLENYEQHFQSSMQGPIYALQNPDAQLQGLAISQHKSAHHVQAM